MTYLESLEWLYGLQVHGIKLGLENMRRLCAALEIETRSSDRCRIIHVAGTNGKGSVCAIQSAICGAMGLRTALYTSPHLVSFRERIRMGAELIPESDVAEGIVRIRAAIAEWGHSPTFFEVTTALALAWFQRQRAEVVILETGLGGRLDATNVVTPAVSVITSIGLDHTQYLGTTLAAVAAEKAGIIKPHVPVLSVHQAPEVAQVLKDAAHRIGAPLTFIRRPIDDTWELALAGKHQRWNAALAFAGVIETGLRPIPARVGIALASVDWPGRFQRVSDRIVIDGAHNPPAAAQLAETWREEYPGENAVIILGMLADKDAAGVVDELLPIASRIICVPVRSPRALAPGDLAKTLRERSPDVGVAVAGSFSAALADAAQGNPRILVCGSLFLVGEALVHFGLAEGTQEWSAQ